MRPLLGAAIAAFVLALAGPAHGAGWVSSVHPNVSGKTIVFTSGDASGTDDVWAAGYVHGPVGGAYEFRTMVQHFNGSTWTRENTRDRETTPGQNLIWDISAPSHTDVWIVGHSKKSATVGASTPLVEHYDGTAWSIVDLPRQGLLESLGAVAASTDGQVWAAGDKPNPASGYYQPLLWHRTTAGAWQEMPFAPVAGCRTTADGAPYEMYPLAGYCATASCTSPGGAGRATDRSRGWLVRRNRDGGWRTLITPDSLPGNSRLEGLDMGPNGLLRTVGASDTGALSFRVGGTTVTQEAVPGNPPLEDVAAGPGGTAFSVGYMSLLANVNGRWPPETWSSPAGVAQRRGPRSGRHRVGVRRRLRQHRADPAPRVGTMPA